MKLHTCLATLLSVSFFQSFALCLLFELMLIISPRRGLFFRLEWETQCYRAHYCSHCTCNNVENEVLGPCFNESLNWKKGKDCNWLHDIKYWVRSHIVIKFETKNLWHVSIYDTILDSPNKSHHEHQNTILTLVDE